MPRTSYSSWHCDNCGSEFKPTKNQRAKKSRYVTCGDRLCKGSIMSRTRVETERRRHEQVTAGVEFASSIAERPAERAFSSSARKVVEKHPVSAPNIDHGLTRGLAISDLHAPFHEPEFIEMALAVDADWCIIVGDPMEQYAFSRFVKFKPVTWQEEESATRDLIGRIKARWGHVICIPGNHDNRLVKSVAASVPPAILHRLLAAGHALDPLGEICADIGIEYPRRHDRYGNELSWLHQVGDAVFLHAEVYSSAGTALVPRRIEERLRQHAATFDLQPWRLAVQAHTHNLSWTPINAGQLVVESGCLCQTHGYQTEPTLKGLPQRHGWVTLEQRGGVTDLSSVRPVWADQVAGRATAA